MTDEYAIQMLIADYFRAYDAHDWVGMRVTLADELKIDFSTPRGGRPALISVNPDSFVRQRSNAISSVRMTHEFEVLSMTIDEDVARTTCRFAIKRYADDDERHFHSWGEYKFALIRDPRRGWRIRSIAQMTWRTDGDAKLHAVPAGRKIA
jgi:hypothetical protein